MLEILRQRRSIRQFADRPVEAEKRDILLEAALRAPSSRGHNPWAFIVVDDRSLLEQLGSAKQHGSTFLKHAPLAIVVAADTTRSDVWTEDCSIAAIILQLTAETLGLGSCWVQIRMRPHSDTLSADARIRQLLGLPEAFAVECVIGIGYPAEQKNGRPASSLLREQVHYNHYGTEFFTEP